MGTHPRSEDGRPIVLGAQDDHAKNHGQRNQRLVQHGLVLPRRFNCPKSSEEGPESVQEREEQELEVRDLGIFLNGTRARVFLFAHDIDGRRAPPNVPPVQVETPHEFVKRRGMR